MTAILHTCYASTGQEWMRVPTASALSRRLNSPTLKDTSPHGRSESQHIYGPNPHRPGLGTMLCLRAAACSVALCVIAGCTLGPNFKSPAPNYGDMISIPIEQNTASTKVIGGDAEALQVGGEVAGRWWELYRSAELTSLVEQAARDNPDLQAACEALNRAKQLELAEGSKRLPALDANVSQQRRRHAQAEDGDVGPASYYSISNVHIGAVYDLDLWGGIRRSIEASGAQTDYAHFEMEAAYLALTSNVVTTVIEKSAIDEKIRIQQHIVEIDQNWLDIMVAQAGLGTSSDFDVALQQSTLARSKSVMETLLMDREQVQHRLAALMGKPVSAVSDISIDLDTLRLPRTLPVTLPSKLIEQRPDIKAAEAVLHAQTALVGVAAAQRLPDITISGRLGSASLDATTLFGPGSGLWSVSAGVTQTIFDAGKRRYRQRAQEAAMREADARWRTTVVEAFHSLSDVLSSLQHDAVKLQLAANGEMAAHHIQMLLEHQRELGSVSVLKVLAAQQTYQNASLELVQARAQRFVDTVVLYRELGGGWWNRGDVGQYPAH
ncbi:efflux transporter outer membrane subunit [Xanthomonas albilineans]|uniref:efflux transporter outer membrane subunit n=1 Tax=Xanthomonas albilineans TaxID=29447 RepID=UPI002E132630|nr:efflux transporter outer membrane subunit [Xanthomonas albilineans]